ncbi:DEAD/DEAH box helicase [Solicola gregarius]|uniref:DEAD/DEAH box helicase n=1 Tax=Solicola gregarius TaxID=2908642 RepID=A0AA46TGR8_9ACTN|nr:DEAD/DEAH box helicase [Solicola gregarius]UYM05062.1 DEAD/DEAH box helicase [Solicola gregarius]
MTSPAERYAQFRADQARPALTDFRRLYDFDLDAYQIEACQALEDGHGVLLAAPTGSGKTILGEFAVHLALEQGRKCFYTTPIKALSNQKYADLVARHGERNVGLLTGDNSVNGEAPIVVMTTEVLRNMLYAGSRTLEGLGYVVMDEVHYLADRFRGAVWEEVIIHLPESVSVVSLSATVSNAEEFGDWLSEVRGDTVTVVEERRPVPLYQHVMVGRRMFDLFESDDQADGNATRVNRELERIARDEWRARTVGKSARGRGARPGKGGSRGRSYAASRHRGRHYTPSRVDVLNRLDAAGLLPAIVFIFSRAGCAAAVRQCLASGLRLTTPSEEAEIRAFVAEHCAHIPRDDLQVLGYHDFAEGLSRGIASHHAGLLPTFKECVEELFSRGLVKAVFATETLALGINMPARSVVLERLSKWNGETHADVTPGEYTQLTGRAGRRGIDVEGHGVVLWQPGLDPRQVAGLASKRTYPLRSSFHPSYNMAVNLVRQVGRSTTREMLEQSFAQFQADRAVVGLARKVRKAEEALEGYAEAAQGDAGDFIEYARLRRRIGELESKGARRRKAVAREQAVDSLNSLKPGDVIDVPGGRWAGLAVVVDPGTYSDPSGPRPLVLTLDRHSRRLAAGDFPTPVEPLLRMRIPKSYNPRNPGSRRDLASALRAKTQDVEAQGRSRRREPSPADPELEELRERLRAHPCHQASDREDRVRWADRYLKLERDTAQQRRQIETRTNTIARQFDRVCEVLDELGYLDGDAVTPDGERLTQLYSELDLVASECIRRGTWDDLSPEELCAALSGLTYEARNPDAIAGIRYPTAQVRTVASRMTGIAADLERVERDHRLSFLRRPDFGFAYAAWQWASGRPLDEVLTEAELEAGDFVRAVKLVLDVADQVANAAGPTDLRDTARDAAGLLRRGVVAYTSLTQ